MRIINLTQHGATPEQIDAGVLDVSDRQLLQRLLTLPAADLAAMTPANQQAFLADRANEIVARFVTPELINVAEDFLEGVGGGGIRCSEGGVTALNLIRGYADHLAAMIGGAPYMMAPLERAIGAIGVRVCYALSDRVSTETAYPDGSIKKTSEFRHVGFYWAA